MMEPIRINVRNRIIEVETSKSKADIFVSATSWLVGISVGFTVNALLKQNVEVENKRQQVELAVGSMALGWVTKEIVREKVEKRMYEWIDEIKEAKAEAEDKVEQKLAAKRAKG